MSRLCNIRDAEKERLDSLQDPAATGAPTAQRGAGRTLSCQAGHGDAKSGEACELASSSTRKTIPAQLAALIYRAGSEPWQQAETSVQ